MCVGGAGCVWWGCGGKVKMITTLYFGLFGIPKSVTNGRPAMVFNFENVFEICLSDSPIGNDDDRFNRCKVSLVMQPLIDYGQTAISIFSKRYTTSLHPPHMGWAKSDGTNISPRKI